MLMRLIYIRRVPSIRVGTFFRIYYFGADICAWIYAGMYIYILFDQGSFFSSMTIVSSEYVTLPDNGGYCVRTKDSDGNPFGYKVSFVNIVY